MKRPLICFSLMPFFLTACSAMPGILNGNDLSHLSLRDKRMANQHIRVLSLKPEHAQALGVIHTSRCQSTLFSDAPQESSLEVDLKAQAYRLGANALTNMRFTTKGAIAQGCWRMYFASATMLELE